MERFTVVSRIRLFASIAPVVLLIAMPIVAYALTQFGHLPADMHDHEIAAIRYAQGLDSALYKMEWGKAQPDGSQIVLDQQRRFADLIDSEVHVLYTPEQQARLHALATAAKPTLDAFRTADPHDEAMNAKMRTLHSMVGDLMNADDDALTEFGQHVALQATAFAILVLVAGIVVPLGCAAIVWRTAGKVRAGLRALRSHLEPISERPIARDPAAAPQLAAMDEALAGLGFPKPNPMLAE